MKYHLLITQEHLILTHLPLHPNGSEKIVGSTASLTVSTERAANTLVYVDGTQGWLLTNN